MRGLIAYTKTAAKWERKLEKTIIQVWSFGCGVWSQKKDQSPSLESAAPYVPPVGTLTSKPRTPESALQTSSSALHVSKYDIKDDEDDDC